MQRQRKQAGQITVRNSRWYVRYYERFTAGGEIQSRRVMHVLGPVTTRGKTPPPEIVTECERHMATINLSTVPVEQCLSLVDFVEKEFLPRAEQRLKPTTYRNYLGDWQRRLKPLVRRDRTLLKDYKTVHVQHWLDQIGQGKAVEKELSQRRQGHDQRLLQRGAAPRLLRDGVNPAQDTKVNPDAPGPAETYAYSLEEIWSMLSRFPEPAATAFAVAAYTGLRRGEIEGLEWSDYRDGEEPDVQRSYRQWRNLRRKRRMSRSCRSSHSAAGRAAGAAQASGWQSHHWARSSAPHKKKKIIIKRRCQCTTCSTARCCLRSIAVFIVDSAKGFPT